MGPSAYWVIIYSAVISCTTCAPTIDSTPTPSFQKIIKTEEIAKGSIDYKLINKPHHLFIGRCKPTDNIIHQENVILHNDGKSHVAARIRMNVDGEVYITCVKIHDEVPNGAGGYPSFVAGGVGHNYVEFNVMTAYGKGFHFFVQIFGHDIDKSTTENHTYSR